jgi:hypothetical protein
MDNYKLREYTKENQMMVLIGLKMMMMMMVELQ